MASVPKGQWTWVYASGIASTDCAPGSADFGLQLGGSAQALDLGPAYVLNLGPQADPQKLPSN
jgi:hypothetical protein